MSGNKRPTGSFRGEEAFFKEYRVHKHLFGDSIMGTVQVADYGNPDGQRWRVGGMPE